MFLCKTSRNSRWALLWKTDWWISAWFRHIPLGSCHGAPSLHWPQVFVRWAGGKQASYHFIMLFKLSYFNRPVEMDTWMVVQQNVDAFTLRFCMRLKLFIWSKNAQTSILLFRRESSLGRVTFSKCIFYVRQFFSVFLLFESLSWSVLITSFWLKLCISVQQNVLKEWEVLWRFSTKKIYHFIKIATL